MGLLEVIVGWKDESKAAKTSSLRKASVTYARRRTPRLLMANLTLAPSAPARRLMLVELLATVSVLRTE